MIQTNQLIRSGSQFLNTNAPAMLTAFGAVGVIGTAVLTAKATFKSAKDIYDENVLRGERDGEQVKYLTKSEEFKLVWINYLPAATTGLLSVGAIVMSHRISSRRAAVLAAAYALNEKKLEEYQEKIKEKFGVKKEKEARDELAQDKVDHDYESAEVIFSPLDGKALIRDDYSGRFFWSSVEEVNRAVNEINREILITDSQTLSDFYDLLGLSPVSTSDAFGWNTNERLEIDWSTTTTPDGSKAVHSFEFVNPPIMNPGARASFR